MAKRELRAIFADAETRLHVSNLLAGETERGCALVGGAMVDESLGDLLHACIGDSTASWEQVLDGSGPLKSFSARALVASALGFISEDERADVKDVREIRNEAAHVLGTPSLPWSFSNDAMKVRCLRLRAFPMGDGAAPRSQFVGSVAMLTAGFQGRAAAVREARAREGQLGALQAAVADAIAVAGAAGA